MVDHAQRWAKKRNWQFLYINDYLDTTRRDAKEVGFWYLEKQFKKNEKKKAARKAQRAKKAQKAQKRKTAIKADRVEKYGYRSIKPGTNRSTDYEKAAKAVRKYLHGQITSQELFFYVENNLNQSIREGLKNIINNETQKLKTYDA